jgi:hypothetical protein
MTHDADPDQEPVAPLIEPLQESQRNLASILLHDLNTVAVAAASAYAVKKVPGRGPDDKGGDDHGPKPS